MRSKSDSKKNGTPNIIIPIVIVVLAIAAFFLFVELKKGDRFPDVQLVAAESSDSNTDPCVGCDRCIVVYLAPWCSACRRSLDVVRQLNEMFGEDPEVGLLVFVGSAPRGDVEAMAAQIEGPVFVDPDAVLWDQLGVEGYPHWFTLDGRGQILQTVAGTYQPFAHHLQMLGMN